jgi:hypothetical protein
MSSIPATIREALRPVHELKSHPAEFLCIKAGTARASARRIDDRKFEAGDCVVFVQTTPGGTVLEPREELEAVITHVDRWAGDRDLYGAPPWSRDRVSNFVPMAVIHFRVIHHRAVDADIDVDQVLNLEGIDNDLRKVLSFASSAGHTISVVDALEIIKDVCRKRLCLTVGGSR